MGARHLARRWIQTFQEARLQPSLLHRVRDFKGFVPLSLESQGLKITTARSGHELLRVLQLRHEIFVEEWQGRRAFHGLDVDDFDFRADHLMITDIRTDQVIGTYRLLSSHFTHDFYSSSEFALSDFLRVPRVKLEMGRACVHKDYRDGRTIDVLWQGLAQYVTETKTELLFGCSSVRTMDPALVKRLFCTLRSLGQWSDGFSVSATSDYTFPGFHEAANEPLTASEKRELLPPLLRSYLHAGAKVLGEPALDRDFSCVDIFTVLDWTALNPRFRARFAPPSGRPAEVAPSP
jgi:putative hemolysin